MSSPFIQIFSSSCMKSSPLAEGWARSEFYPCALSSTSPDPVLGHEIGRLRPRQPHELTRCETEEVARRVELEPNRVCAERGLIQEHEGPVKGKGRGARGRAKSCTVRRGGELLAVEPAGRGNEPHHRAVVTLQGPDGHRQARRGLGARK